MEQWKTGRKEKNGMMEKGKKGRERKREQVSGFRRQGGKEGYRNQVSGFRNRERIKGKSKRIPEDGCISAL